MRILILQSEAACARAIASALGQEMPVQRERIRIMSPDEVADEASLIRFIENNSHTIQIIILDPHLRIGHGSSQSGGLRVYRQIVLRRLSKIRIVTTSFESREKIARSSEYKRFFDGDWISVNPHVQLPFISEQMGTVLQQLLTKEV